jgi:hypothetical protein
MIAIDDKLISDDVVEKQFVCDLIKCKGGCCEEGDAGAPLEKKEMQLLQKNFESIKSYLTKEGLETIEQKGYYHYTAEFGWVTPAIEGKMCAYGFRDENGIIKCGIEKAYNDGKTNWRKPLSCHLYPIKTKKTNTHEIINYQPRPDLCKPGCELGEKLKVPAYQFLKDALIRKYGQEFYDALDKIAKKYYAKQEKIDL